MSGVLLAPLTILFEFNFPFNKLPVLGAPVVYPLTVLAGKLYESIL